MALKKSHMDRAVEVVVDADQDHERESVKEIVEKSVPAAIDHEAVNANTGREVESAIAITMTDTGSGSAVSEKGVSGSAVTARGSENTLPVDQGAADTSLLFSMTSSTLSWIYYSSSPVHCLKASRGLLFHHLLLNGSCKLLNTLL